MERKEKEDKRRNIIIKGLEVKEERKSKETVLRDIEVETETEKVRKIGRRLIKGREMVLIKVAKKDQKREIMKNKSKLKGRKIVIGEDLTWRERKMRWNLEEIARGRKGKGTGYG